MRLTCFRVADERQTIRDIRGCGTKTGSDALDCLDTSLGQLSREMRGTLRSNNDILATLQRGRCRALLAGEGTAADRRLIVATNQLTSLLGTAGDPAAIVAAISKWKAAARAVDENASKASRNPGGYLRALKVCRP